MNHVVGLDLGGTNIKAVALGADPEGPSLVASRSAPTLGHLGAEAVVARLADAARDVFAAGSTDPGPTAVGVTVPGAFDAATGTVRLLPNLPGWEGVELVRELEQLLDAPVFLVNDSQAFTLAEGRIGAGRGARMIAGLTLGTGIGGGILIDGVLHTGPSGSAGEFGHQTIVSNGPECGCGRHGCLESVARPPAVAARAGYEDFEATVQAHRAGDTAATEAIDAMIDHLSTGVGNILTMLGPDVVVIGGGAAQADLVVDAVARIAPTRAPLVDSDVVSIVAAALGTESGAIGAALHAAGGGRTS
jgi:glucokinase